MVSTLISQSDSTDIFSQKEGVGIIELKGLIVSSEPILKHLAEFRNNPDVKSIVLRIDSPGGAVGAAQEIFQDIARTNEVKPVIASMGSMGASGGYYAALGADTILANPGTMTGSIGVIVKFPNLKGLFDKIGYETEVVKSGPLKDIGSSDRSMTDEERQLMQDLIDNVYHQFVRDVAAARSLPEETVIKLADGRVYTGEQAVELGLIDRLGNFTDAIETAAELGELDTEEPRLIYPKSERRFSLLSLLTSAEQSLVENFVPLAPILSYEWRGAH